MVNIDLDQSIGRLTEKSCEHAAPGGGDHTLCCSDIADTGRRVP